MSREPSWRRYLRFNRPDPGADVDDELRFHLEELERRYAAAGLSRDDARRAARHQFGDVDGVRDLLSSRSRSRQRRSERSEWWLRLRQDIRIGLRKLLHQPAFTLTAVATLALGIGATAAVFSVVNATLLRPLPYPAADRIVSLHELTEGKRPFTASAPDFMDWRSQTTAFSAMAAYNTYPRTLTGHGDPLPVASAIVTADFFDAMGVHPARGRGFTADELVLGQTDVAILGDGLWRSTFGGAEDIIGQSIQLEGRTRVVVGIMPPGFDFPSGTRVWTPWVFSDDELRTQRGAHYLEVVARLKDGVPFETGVAQVTAVADRLAREYPSTNDKYSAGGQPLRDALVGDTARRSLILLMGAVLLVTLIACANVANLMLARGERRQREMAVRASLGARPRDLVGAALTESVLLALLGGGAGLVLAWWATAALTGLQPEALGDVGAASIDVTVLVFTLGVSVVTGLLFGLTPALQSLRAGAAQGTLRAEGRGNTTGREAWRIRGTLVAAELTLAVMLLAGAGLLIRSFAGLQAVDPGFATADLLTFQVGLPEARYPTHVEAAQFFPRLLEEVRAIPGVTAADAITGLPLDNNSYSMSTPFLDGVRQDPTKEPSTQIRIVTQGLFRTMGIRLLRGRGFEPGDRLDAPGAVVLSESAAARLFPGQDALGHTMQIGTGFGMDRGRAGGTVVGIVSDIHDQALGTAPRPTTYLLHDQWPVSDMALVVRGATPLRLAPAVRETLRRIDPLLPMVAVRTMEQVTSTSVAQSRFVMLLLASFAGVALVLAAIGVFGVMSFVVGQRTREIGVRIALGAAGRTVVADTVRRALAPVAIGVVVGVAGAVALSRTIETLLYGVTPADPLTFGTVATVLAAVAVVAAWIPARKASRVDPVIALRAE